MNMTSSLVGEMFLTKTIYLFQRTCISERLETHPCFKLFNRLEVLKISVRLTARQALLLCTLENSLYFLFSIILCLGKPDL